MATFMSPQARRSKRQFASRLGAQATSSRPSTSPWQIVAQAAQGALSGYTSRRVDQDERAETASNKKTMRASGLAALGLRDRLPVSAQSQPSVSQVSALRQSNVSPVSSSYQYGGDNQPSPQPHQPTPAYANQPPINNQSNTNHNQPTSTFGQPNIGQSPPQQPQPVTYGQGNQPLSRYQTRQQNAIRTMLESDNPQLVERGMAMAQKFNLPIGKTTPLQQARINMIEAQIKKMSEGQASGKVMRVGNNLVRVAPDGTASSIYEGDEQPQARKTIKGIDGRQHFVDNGELVLPDVTQAQNSTNRKIIKGPDGRNYFVDNQQPVLPNVQATVVGGGGNEFEKARQRILGKNRGQAEVDLPEVMLSSKRVTGQVDELLQHPSLDAVVGPYDSITPTILGGSQDAEARINQLGGAAFLQAFKSIKGAGSISETEGLKATQAFARLTATGQNEASYRLALEDFKKEVAALVEIAKQKAGVQVPQQGQSQPGGGVPGSTVPQEALKFLRRNSSDPSVIHMFNQKYGAGSAASYLGGK